MNPMDMLKAMRGKMNPQQMVMNMIKNNSNPIFLSILPLLILISNSANL